MRDSDVPTVANVLARGKATAAECQAWNRIIKATMPELPEDDVVIEHVHDKLNGYVGHSPGDVIREVLAFVRSRVASA